MVKQLKTSLGDTIFFLRNWLSMYNAANFQTVCIGGITYRGYTKTDAEPIAQVYFQLNHGAKFSWGKRCLYGLIGDRLLLVATYVSESGESIVGMNMYYLNPRDVQEHTIHEGFIGVLPEVTGKGIATTMRRISKSHFAREGFKGISTRISLKNARSLHSAIKTGFELVEQYIDPHSHEERYYMLCKF